MPDVRWVCLSDLHFGAENSLLTHVVVDQDAPSGGDVKVIPGEPSTCLIDLVACLSDLIGRNEDTDTKPSLVLNGDILEFALAQDQVAAMAFERFVELALTEQQLFARIYLIPGNHDHHLWETARERQYAKHVGTLTDPATALPAPWHATNLRTDGEREIPVESELIRALLDRHKVTVPLEVRYPNFGLYSDDGKRAVVFHHGHYIEPVYLLMTRLQKAIFPASAPGREVWDWEAQNFAWIDFFWSTLGRSGTWGTDVGVIYDMLQSKKATEAMGHNVAKAVAGAVKLPTPIPAVIRWVLTKLIRFGLARGKGLERKQPGSGAEAPQAADPLSKRGRAGLHAYLTGPLALQIAAANVPKGRMPDDITFVFGHTHKPYQQALAKEDAYQKFPQYRSVYNTGGWVVDTLEPESRHGAAVVVVAEDLTVASIHMYQQQPVGLTPHPVEVCTADGLDDPFLDALRGRIEAGSDVWSRFTADVTKKVPERYTALQILIDRGIAQLNKAPTPDVVG